MNTNLGVHLNGNFSFPTSIPQSENDLLQAGLKLMEDDLFHYGKLKYLWKKKWYLQIYILVSPEVLVVKLDLFIYRNINFLVYCNGIIL